MLHKLAAWRAYESLQDRVSSPVAGASSTRLESTLSQLIDDFIYVSNDFTVKEGARLTADLYVGKPLGFGLQVSSRHSFRS